MRAGSLSDPRVVASLRELFVPCLSSALNTPAFSSAEDLALLREYSSRQGGQFQGGEREAFILPDGTMQQVFLSLHGRDQRNGCVQMTAAGRRSEDAVHQFRTHAERALASAPKEVRARWREIWSEPEPEAVRSARAAAPVWPKPAAGAAALRAFVTNSYEQYDELRGFELVPLPAGLADRLLAGLRGPGDRLELDRDLFVALGRALVPRGQVGTRLAERSIAGSLRLVVESADGQTITGRVEGELSLRPEARSEVGLRDNAVTMFTHASRLSGRFVLDRERKAVRELIFVSRDVRFDWLTRMKHMPWQHEPRHEYAVEWIDGA